MLREFIRNGELATLTHATAATQKAESAEGQPTVAKVATVTVTNRQGNKTELAKVDPLPEWQADFCSACADFNNWRGCCPKPLDGCLVSKIIDSGGSLDKLKGLEIGHGITTDQVIDEWLRSNEPAEDLISKPAWLICLAEHLSKGESHV